MYANDTARVKCFRTGAECLAMAALLVGAARAQTATDLPVETHVQQVRQLTPEQAGRAAKVHLRGVVTALSGWKDSFFFEDATGGISIDRRDDARVKSGDEVEGVTGAGLFAPMVISDRVTVTGRRTLPIAKSVSYADLALGRQDSQWVRVRGVVHSADVSESWGRQVLMMTIDLGEGSITARIHDFDPIDFSYLMGTVQITGVVGTVFNQKRQFIGLRLFLPDIEFLEIEEPAPADPFSVPATSIESLWLFGVAHAASHRIKIAGTASHQRSGQVLYLRNGASGIAVESSQTAAVAPGDLVEAVGFVEPGDYAQELHDAAFRKIGAGTPLAPVHIAAANALAIGALAIEELTVDKLIAREQISARKG